MEHGDCSIEITGLQPRDKYVPQPHTTTACLVARDGELEKSDFVVVWRFEFAKQPALHFARRLCGGNDNPFGRRQQSFDTYARVKKTAPDIAVVTALKKKLEF